MNNYSHEINHLASDIASGKISKTLKTNFELTGEAANVISMQPNVAVQNLTVFDSHSDHVANVIAYMIDNYSTLNSFEIMEFADVIGEAEVDILLEIRDSLPTELHATYKAWLEQLSEKSFFGFNLDGFDGNALIEQGSELLNEEQCSLMGEIQDKVWYVGRPTQVDDPTTSIGLALFATDNPIQAFTYAGDKGVIYELEIKESLDRILQHQSPYDNGRFSPVTFDQEVKDKLMPNHAIMVKLDRDSGMYSVPSDLESLYKDVTNLALHKSINPVSVVREVPALALMNEFREKNGITIKKDDNKFLNSIIAQNEKCTATPTQVLKRTKMKL